MADRVTIRISPELSEALDRFVEAEVAPVRSRQEAFRHIAWRWLTDKGYAASPEQDAISRESQRS